MRLRWPEEWIKGPDVAGKKKENMTMPKKREREIGPKTLKA